MHMVSNLFDGPMNGGPARELVRHIVLIYRIDMSGEMMVLGLLHLAEMSAYDVKKSMEKLASHYFGASLGSIVPHLHRLEASGAARVRSESVGRRAKKIYSPTTKGRARFRRWMLGPTDLERDEDELLVKIFFFGLIEEDERRSIVEECCVQLREREEHLKQLKRDSEKQLSQMNLPRQIAEVPHYQIKTMEFGAAHYRFVRRWLEKELSR